MAARPTNLSSSDGEDGRVRAGATVGAGPSPNRLVDRSHRPVARSDRATGHHVAPAVHDQNEYR
jgi:hypothetical protein